jgi:hypothetical protein
MGRKAPRKRLACRVMARPTGASHAPERLSALRPPLDWGERSKSCKPGRKNVPRERDGLFDMVNIAIGRAAISVRSSPRKRGPMITGRCSWVPALAALGRDDDGRMHFGQTNPTAILAKRSQHTPVVPRKRRSLAGGHGSRLSLCSAGMTIRWCGGPTCGCRKRAPAHPPCFRPVLYREPRNFNVSWCGSSPCARRKLPLAVEPAHAGHFVAQTTNARDRRVDRLERDCHVESVGVKERCRVAHDRHVAMPKQEIAAPQV